MKRLLSFSLLLLLSACSQNTTGRGPANASSVSPGVVSPGMPNASYELKVSGWLPTWTGATGRDAITNHIGHELNEANPFWYSLKSDGTFSAVNGSRDAQLIAAVKAAGGEFIPTIYDVADKTATAAVLADPAKRDLLVQGLTNEVLTYNYDGIDIDLEHVKSSNKASFHIFLADLRDALHQHNKLLSIAIPGKRKAGPSWAGYDYHAVGPIVDRFKIMTYGYSGPWSNTPGPIAPNVHIKRILDYTVTIVPREKIYIGIPFYGYDWPSDGSKIRSVTAHTVGSRLALSTNGMRFDPSMKEATFEYSKDGVDHVVWYQNDQSITEKCNLCAQYRVGGVAIWAVGYGDSSHWNAIRDARQNAANAAMP